MNTEEQLGWVVAFITAVRYTDAPIYIGIDPGTSGAIAFVSGKYHAVIDIPTTKTKKKRSRRVRKTDKNLRQGQKTKTITSNRPEFDFEAIVTVFSALRPLKDRVTAIVEKVPVMKFGGSRYAEGMLNRAYGMWGLFLHAKRYRRYVEYTPSEWKEGLRLSSTVKDKSRQRAIKLFPAASLSRKADHNRAEALLLIAYHLKRETDG